MSKAEHAARLLEEARAAVAAGREREDQAERDRLTADHIAAALKLGTPVTSKPPILSTGGTIGSGADGRRFEYLSPLGPTPEDLRRRFELALQDLRRRKLSAHAPHGWPVLSLSQEALICRVVAMCRQGGAVELAEGDAREVAHLLDVLSLLARAEWAEASTG